MILENHPFYHIHEISKYWDNATLNFSIYTYNPQSIFDERTFIDVKRSKFDEVWLSELMQSLKPNEELAFHSLVKLNEKNMHVPMIDFSCSTDDYEYAIITLRKVIPSDIFSGFRFYDSGRSMHGYGSCLLKPKEWLNFMGLLLLANMPKQPTLIDSRWVGHRLLGGFSSLRLSSNSGDYLKLPELIK